MARPGTTNWTAILNYWLLDEVGDRDKGHTLKNPETGKPYWDNKADAKRGLEDLQLDSAFEYVIFIQFNDAVFKMKPSKQTRIEYSHSEEDEEQEEESIIRDTSDEVIDENIKGIIEEDKKEEADIEEEIAESALPSIGDDE